MTRSCVASLTAGHAVCGNKSHAFWPHFAAPHHTVPYDAAAHVNLPLHIFSRYRSVPVGGAESVTDSTEQCRR